MILPFREETERYWTVRQLNGTELYANWTVLNCTPTERYWNVRQLNGTEMYANWTVLNCTPTERYWTVHQLNAVLRSSGQQKVPKLRKRISWKTTIHLFQWSPTNTSTFYYMGTGSGVGTSFLGSKAVQARRWPTHFKLVPTSRTSGAAMQGDFTSTRQLHMTAEFRMIHHHKIYKQRSKRRTKIIKS